MLSGDFLYILFISNIIKYQQHKIPEPGIWLTKEKGLVCGVQDGILLLYC